MPSVYIEAKCFSTVIKPLSRLFQSLTVNDTLIKISPPRAKRASIMSCDQCGSKRLLNISAKCADTFYASSQGKETYNIPLKANLGEDDYLSFGLCLNCGKVQGAFPVAKLYFELESTLCDTCGADRLEPSSFFRNRMYCVQCGAIQDQ